MLATETSDLIVVAAARGPIRFTELERAIDGISRRMLTLT
ncbi:MAG: winged helix-turn-helix transcriptional regulator, partial [Actinomycetota bacterium]|nr:winged helix-turn-helix transcriptional regulator [Actinomycetota bacterium]